MDNGHTLLLSSQLTTAPSVKRCRFDCRAKAQQLQEIRVCTNRTCRRQGSFQILETLSGLAPPNVAVKSCGCLGRCGGGPNLAVLPDGLIVSHCGTAARAAEVMATLFAGGYDPVSCLDALALRKRADIEFTIRNFTEAELLLSKACICQGDAFLALNEYGLAEQSYLASLDIDPSIRHSKSFKARISKLLEKLTAANTP